MSCASSSRLEEEDDDVSGSVEPAISIKNSIFPLSFSILTPFQADSHKNLFVKETRHNKKSV